MYSINRAAMIHNITILCPIISIFIKNCYNIPSRHFIIGGKELLSREGTTQGDSKLKKLNYIGTKRSIGPKFGYFPKAKKSFLLVKQQYHSNAQKIFKDSNVKITVTSQRHLGAVIGSIDYKNKFVNEKIAKLTL